MEVNADEYHYNNILVGDRAAGMGGAYTAVSDDPSGLFYNPAGIVLAPGRSFSASVNAYHYSQKEYKDVLGGKGWERRSSNLLPNYFGIIQPLGPGKFGFSYAVPDSRLEDQDQTFYNIPGIDPATNLPLTITRYVINMNDTDYTYNFGPSYAMKINDRLSVGATAYIHYRDKEIISNQFITVDDGRYEWNNVYGSLTEWGVRPIVGLMWEPMEKVSVGLTASKNYILDTDRRLQTTYRGLDYGGSQPAYNVWDSDDEREFPLTVTLGGAYFPSESLLLSADISYYSEADYTIKYKNRDTGAVSRELIPQERVVNVAVGAEYYPSERIALRGGLFTNMANTPDLSSGRANQPENIDMYGLSLSISHFSRSSSLTFGGSYSFGKGEAQPYAGSAEIKDVEMQDITAFISAAYSY
jgi:long-chain fatty acid transport protein